jgi:hypothetical protein
VLQRAQLSGLLEQQLAQLGHRLVRVRLLRAMPTERHHKRPKSRFRYPERPTVKIRVE